MKIIGMVDCYPSYSDGSVRFNFVQLDPSKPETDYGYIKDWNMNIPLEIWAKFKKGKVKITIESYE